MIPKTAIEKAIEGGWIPTKGGYKFKSFNIDTGLAYQLAMGSDAIALDPSFWQALGKALGWGRYMYVGKMERLLDDGKLEGHSWALPVEEYHAHRFYDLILTGGNTEAFWSELLASPTNK